MHGVPFHFEAHASRENYQSRYIGLHHRRFHTVRRSQRGILYYFSLMNYFGHPFALLLLPYFSSAILMAAWTISFDDFLAILLVANFFHTAKKNILSIIIIIDMRSLTFFFLGNSGVVIGTRCYCTKLSVPISHLRGSDTRNIILCRLSSRNLQVFHHKGM